jgi:hypothetical protein
MVLLTALVASQPPVAIGQEPEAPLHGDFAVTIAAEDVPPELIDGAALIGRWQISFAADGSYQRARQDVGALASGRFATDGGQLTLTGETGLLACDGTRDDGGDALYEWELTGDRLQLVAIEEPCAVRRLLLTTRTLSVFVACEQRARGAAPATPVSAPPAPAGASEIDDLLRRMSSCWATREPEQFLPLVSESFRAEIAPNGEEGDRRFSLRMGAPIVWDRAGEVEVIADGRVEATVRQTSGDEVDLVTYAFVFEDGAWRWDGGAARPTE